MPTKRPDPVLFPASTICIKYKDNSINISEFYSVISSTKGSAQKIKTIFVKQKQNITPKNKLANTIRKVKTHKGNFVQPTV